MRILSSPGGSGVRRTEQVRVADEPGATRDCTGLTPVHVNRTLKTLATNGLIDRIGRAVTIGDWNALATAGDFHSGYLHMREDQSAIRRSRASGCRVSRRGP
ncbi:helix-turn-helix domain-containing protein [Sphingomonas solaris]|uniref:helix-turn-helix domain-containing protein n=1 Tax=Alterirhizorhabdus solaris TaxID=2529389 RepID=UPI003B83931D